jgi:subtilisin-like proprotein convertase family protein
MNYSASVSAGSSWLSITSGAAGGNSGTIRVFYAENKGVQRTGQITVMAGGANGSPKTITITQAGIGGGTTPTPTPNPTPIPTPTPPTGLSATDGTYSDRVRITWQPVSGATSYKIYRDGANSPSTAVELTTTTVTSFDDMTIAAGEICYYWVRAFNGSQLSAFSTSDTGYRGSIAGTTFSSTFAINIPLAQKASPYPATLNVAGLSGTITKMQVKVNGFSHTYPSDVNIEVMSPSGRAVMLMSNAGSGNTQNLNFTFDDAATSLLPKTTLASGMFKPTYHIIPSSTNYLPAPADPNPGTTLSVFNGDAPNGSWKLFVTDDAAPNGGSISGWSLIITTTGGFFWP